MATYKFKSSGVGLKETTEDAQQQKIPIGIKTPIELGSKDSDGIFSMHFDLQNQIADNLRNLISTNWGERLGLYNYGANLLPLTTNLSSDEAFDSEAMNRISSAIQRWMPFVTPTSFSSQINRFDNKNTAIIEITLSYKVNSISNDEKKILVTLYAI